MIKIEILEEELINEILSESHRCMENKNFPYFEIIKLMKIAEETASVQTKKCVTNALLLVLALFLENKSPLNQESTHNLNECPSDIKEIFRPELIVC